ncbi:hypothetical protein EYF80_031513 [Liparis tanakae]|uniref:Uncharacterized protein n=1 Tax=Liparis tanakae TaxID=230148 RepID=A0A4Z2GZR8_9TELE|nr:hypothetical protein EYF80_031513 [Liparis tanakae]
MGKLQSKEPTIVGGGSVKPGNMAAARASWTEVSRGLTQFVNPRAPLSDSLLRSPLYEDSLVATSGPKPGRIPSLHSAGGVANRQFAGPRGSTNRAPPSGVVNLSAQPAGYDYMVFNVWFSSHIWLFRLVPSQLIEQLINARYRQRVSAAAASRSAAASGSTRMYFDLLSGSDYAMSYSASPRSQSFSGAVAENM